jgi:4-amino-4-deoxy-L-arabinose transferase-like glycosyltransferase
MVALFNRRSVFLIAAGLFLAGLLRVYQLQIIPVFADEAIYIRWAQVMRAEETLRFLPLTDGKQPLFMWVMIPFLRLSADPLVAGRMVSVVSGIVTVVLGGAVSWLLFRSRRLALLTLCLLAICPYLVFFDRLALVDSFLAMWGMGVLFLGILLCRSTRFDVAMVTGAALGGGWLTKSPGELFFALLPLPVIVAGRKLISQRGYWWRLVVVLMVAWIIGVGFYNILRLGPNFHLISERNRDYVYPLTEVLRHPLTPLVGNLQLALNWLVLLMPLPLFLLALAGLGVVLVGQASVGVLLAAWSILPILITAAIAKVFTARYILFTVPPLVILAARAINRRRSSVLWRGGILLIVILPMLVQDWLFSVQPERALLPVNERTGYLEDWTAGYGLREIAAYLKDQPPDRSIVVGTEGYFGTLPDGLQIYLNGQSNIRFVGMDYPLQHLPGSLQAALADNDVYLVANSNRFAVQFPQEEGLYLIKAYPKAADAAGVTQSMLFYRVLPPEAPTR